MFDACAAAQARGNELYIQITCQPLSFDFTLASAYPFYSHPAFDPIKAYDREQLKAVFRDPSFRDALPRRSAQTRSRARSSRATGTASSSPRRSSRRTPGSPTARSPRSRAKPDATRSTCCSISASRRISTPGFIGRFLNAVDDGVEPLVKHKAGVIALSDAGAHLVYLCDAGLRALFPRPLGARARRLRPAPRACAG